MRRFQGRTSTFSIRALMTCALLAASIVGLIATTGSAAAQDGMVTLRGDPATEAAERERLFAALAKSSNAAEASGIASKVWALWFRAPNTDAAAIMQQALEKRGVRDYRGAVTILDTLVETAPDWAEAWNQRATIRYLLRDFEGSLADIDRVLALEPKHFGALSGQAIILMHQGKMAAGQIALRKAVEIDPFLSERALIMGPAGQDI
jgi:tetratricopeptide (TPR) repeat protein